MDLDLPESQLSPNNRGHLGTGEAVQGGELKPPAEGLFTHLKAPGEPGFWVWLPINGINGPPLKHMRKNRMIIVPLGFGDPRKSEKKLDILTNIDKAQISQI